MNGWKTGLAALLALGVQAGAAASSVLCADSARNHMLGDAALFSGCLGAGLGNIGNGLNDDFLPYAGLSEVSDTGEGGGIWGLHFDQPSHSWAFDAAFWGVYSGGALGFKFGTGGTPDEWFVFGLNAGVSGGAYAFVDVLAPGKSDLRLSHVVLYGEGEATPMPSPSSLALLGLSLAVLGLCVRRPSVAGA